MYQRTELNRWLQENDLNAEELERLMTDEARLEAYTAMVEPSLSRPLLDHLRTQQLYAQLADRAERKHAVLMACGRPDPTPADLGLTPIQLTRWYFEERLGQSVPDDLDAVASRLGLAGRTEFYRLLSREYLFLSSTARSAGGG